MLSVVHTFNPSTHKAETGRSWSSDQPGQQIEFQDSQNYKEKPQGKKKKKEKIQNE